MLHSILRYWRQHRIECMRACAQGCCISGSDDLVIEKNAKYLVLLVLLVKWTESLVGSFTGSIIYLPVLAAALQQDRGAIVATPAASTAALKTGQHNAATPPATSGIPREVHVLAMCTFPATYATCIWLHENGTSGTFSGSCNVSLHEAEHLRAAVSHLQ